MAQTLNDLAFNTIMASYLHEINFSHGRSLCNVANEPLPDQSVPSSTARVHPEIVDGIAFLLGATSREPLALALTTQLSNSYRRKLRLLIATTPEQSETPKQKDLTMLRELHALLCEIHLRQLHELCIPPSSDSLDSVLQSPSFLRFRSRVMEYVWPYLQEEFVTKRRATVFCKAAEAVLKSPQNRRRFGHLLKPELTQGINDLVQFLGNEPPGPVQTKEVFKTLETLRNWAQEVRTWARFQEIWIDEASAIVRKSPDLYPFFNSDISMDACDPVDWLLETSAVCLHIRNADALARSSPFQHWTNVDIDTDYLSPIAPSVSPQPAFTRESTRSLLQKAGCGDRCNDKVLHYIVPQILRKLKIEEFDKGLPDIQARCSYHTSTSVHDVCRVMLALASPPSEPWTALPYIGSNLPPCGFCGLFVRAMNIAVGMRIKTAPIHHSPRLLGWSFPKFPILPPGRDSHVDEMEVAQLMHRDLERVIKDEWDLTYFPFSVPWHQVKPPVESYSDSDD